MIRGAVLRGLATGLALAGLILLLVGLGQAANAGPWALTVGGALLLLVAATGLALLATGRTSRLPAPRPAVQSAQDHPPSAPDLPSGPTRYVRLPGTVLPLRATDPDDLLLDYLVVLTPQDFEHFCRALLEAMGYEQVQVQGKAGDAGVDLTMRRGDALLIAQCKRYQGNVGAPALRDFYGALMHTGAAQGFFLTTSDFTQAARDWAAGKPIVLVNGYGLIAAVRRYLLGETS